jgi:hypothetical protein
MQDIYIVLYVWHKEDTAHATYVVRLNICIETIYEVRRTFNVRRTCVCLRTACNTEYHQKKMPFSCLTATETW